MAKSMDILCSNCQKRFDGVPKFTLWGLKKCTCPHCNRIVLYPMGLGQLILNWGILFIFLLLVIGSLGNGGFVLPGIFVVLAGIAVSKDIIVRSDIRKQVAARVSPVVDDNQSDEEISRSECRITPYANSRNYGSKPNILHWKPYILIFSLVIAASLLPIIRYHYSNAIPQRIQAEQKREIATALTEIQKTYSDIVEKSTNPDGFPQPIEGKIDTRPKAKGEVGEVERCLKEWMVQIALPCNKYTSELNNIGFSGLLDAERIEKDKDFSESRAILSGANSALRRYEYSTIILFKEWKDKTNNYNVSTAIKSAMRAGYDKAEVQLLKYFNTYIELEKNALRELEGIIDLLESRKGNWIVQNNRILFYSDDDIACYNAHLSSIRQIAKTQLEIQQRTEKKDE